MISEAGPSMDACMEGTCDISAAQVTAVLSLTCQSYRRQELKDEL